MDVFSSLPVRTENLGDVSTRISDGNIPSQQLSVDVNGKIQTKLSDGAGNEITSTLVSGKQSLDVNVTSGINVEVDLNEADDSVSVFQDTHDNLNLNANIQVGDTDVSNANPVPVSDAGGSLTVDATDLDIRDLSHLQDSVKIGDGVDFLAINNDGSINAVVSATNLDIRDLDANTDSVSAFLKDGGGIPITSTTTGLGQSLDVSLKDANGNIFGSAMYPLSVALSPNNDGEEVNDHDLGVNIVIGATSTHTYTVPASKILYLTQIEASASGRMKIEVRVETGVATNTFVTKFVQFNSTANPNCSIELKSPITVQAGVRVQVLRTNRDLALQDVYSTISGQLVTP